MYVPRHFAFPADADSALHDVIEAHNFGLLVAAADAGPASALEAVHLPFLLDRGRGARGTLIAHVARANPIWRSFAPGREVLTIFQGAHAYVSPDWYASEGLVPTWNYVAVHGYGLPRILTAAGEVRAALVRLSAVMEEGLAPKPPWTLARLPEASLAGLLRGVVAFEIELTRLEGKRKLNQNRAPQDRAGVIEALEAAGSAEGRAMARTMRALD